MNASAQLISALVVTMFLGLADRPASAELVWFYGGSFDNAIPDDPETSKGWMNDAVVTVCEHHIVHDLNVSVSLTHTNVFDLQLTVVSPSGTRVVLNAYDPFTEYFEGADYTRTVFDDEAALRITDATPPFTGSFRPRSDGALSVFDGEDAFGEWHLRIYDSAYADTGQLSAFGLTITTPEPGTAMLLLIGWGVLRSRRRHEWRRY
jgi:hypothetical protein